MDDGAKKDLDDVENEDYEPKALSKRFRRRQREHITTLQRTVCVLLK